jgi:hypothetical protein
VGYAPGVAFGIGCGFCGVAFGIGCGFSCGFWYRVWLFMWLLVSGVAFVVRYLRAVLKRGFASQVLSEPFDAVFKGSIPNSRV